MKRMSCIDEAQPSWHLSSPGERPVKQQTNVLHHLRPLSDLWRSTLSTVLVKVLGSCQILLTVIIAEGLDSFFRNETYILYIQTV